MHLTNPLLPLLPLLSAPLILALTSPSQDSLTQTNITLPHLLPPSPNANTNLNITDLGEVGLECFDPTGPHTLAPVSLDSCLDATSRMLKNLPPSVYLLPRLFKTAASTQTGGTKVPLTWTNNDPPGCMVKIDNFAGMAGLTDAAEFSLVGAAYFASLVVANCVRDVKHPAGGRFTIADGGFFIDVRAYSPLSEHGGDEGVVATA